MKKNFKAFYSPPNPAELKTLWDNATIIIDTNVLLSLYRYKDKTTKEFLQLLEKYKEKLWIPFHVGLEYQRNRLSIIANQKNTFNEINTSITQSINAIEKNLTDRQLEKRHSNIPSSLIDSFMTDLKSLQDNFFEQLKPLQSEHMSVRKVDLIRDRLDLIYSNNIGSAPENQSQVDQWNSDAEERYQKKIPPGYEDQGKNNNINDNIEFSYKKLKYNRKYGDYYIWQQIINFAKQNSKKYIIFVTDDTKEDWWLKIKEHGEKIISPRHELIDEIMLEANVDCFHMYTSEDFMEHAKSIGKIEISDDTMQDIKETSTNSRSIIEQLNNSGCFEEDSSTSFLDKSNKWFELNKWFKEFNLPNNNISHMHDLNSNIQPCNSDINFNNKMKLQLASNVLRHYKNDFKELMQENRQISNSIENEKENYLGHQFQSIEKSMDIHETRKKIKDIEKYIEQLKKTINDSSFDQDIEE